MRTKFRLSIFLLFLFAAVLLPLQVCADADYEDGQECWNCGHYHWGDYMHDCGACSPDCTNDWCALETHCRRCGGCLNGDYPCDECGMYEDCAVETDEVQIKADHLYTVCENITGSGASTTLRIKTL